MAKIDLLQFGDGEFNQAHVTEISDALDEDYRHLYGLSIHYINSSTTVTGKDSRVTASVDLSSKSDVYDRQEWVGRKGELDVTFHREIDSTIVGNLQRDQKFQELTVKSATISYEERTNISQSKYKDTFTYRDYETALRIGDRIAQHYRLTRKAVISHETPASYGGGQYGIVSESVGGSWTPEQVDKYEEELTVFFNDGTTETKTWNIPKSKVGISVRYVYEEQ